MFGKTLKTFKLDEPSILVEQLLLVMQQTRTNAIHGAILVCLTAWALWNENNRWMLVAWVLTIFIVNINNVRFSQRYLKAISESNSLYVFKCLGFIQLGHGLVWGLLPWATLDTATTTDTVIIFCVLAGMTGGVMPSLASIPLFFLLHTLPWITLIGIKLLLVSQFEYNALLLASLLYVSLLYGHAKSSYAVILKNIKLNFENEMLVEKLRKESILSQQANIAKSKFLAAASHDIRQPIHAQGLFLSVLNNTPLNQQQKELIESLNASNQASAEMLNTLLDFSRLEAGVIQANIKPVKMQTLLNKIEREFAQQADVKGLAYRSRETSLFVATDPALLEIILRNLVSNSIRYTRKGGVLVTIRKRGNMGLLEVRDTGIGIDKDFMEDIFNEFYQIDEHYLDNNASSHKVIGLGLGLAIVSRLSRLLKHTLSVQSKKDKGSLFQLLIPLTKAPLTHKEIDVHPALNSLEGVSVLLIDDDPAIRKSTQYLLSTWGCECKCADGMQAAIAIASSFQPSLIICDYRLQGKENGPKVIERIRTTLNNEHLPAILITGETSHEYLQEAFRKNIHIMHKPVNVVLMHSKLTHLLSKSKTLYIQSDS